MAEKETENKPKDMVEAVPEELEKLEKVISKVEELAVPQAPQKPMSFQEKRALRDIEMRKKSLEEWVPKTKLGILVKQGKEKDFDKVLSEGKRILEPEIVDILLPGLESDLLLVGQSKGKFGGGKRRAWRQTQKKTQEGNVATFSCVAVVGDKKGHIGLGLGKAKETLPAREKALRHAKLSIVKIIIGFESPEEKGSGNEPHTVPFVTEGKCGSVRLKLMPAPRGTGLAAADECKKILRLAGIKDVYTDVKGQTRTTLNLAKACINALLNTKKMKL